MPSSSANGPSRVSAPCIPISRTSRRHLHRERVRFVELPELGVERRRERERAEQMERFVPCLRVLERPELVAKCTVPIPAGKPEVPNALRARTLERVR